MSRILERWCIERDPHELRIYVDDVTLGPDDEAGRQKVRAFAHELLAATEHPIPAHPKPVAVPERVPDAAAPAALRAVLDLHQRDEWGQCSSCVDDGLPPAYPCPTVEAIRAAIGVPS
jgi:hypothetical protein